MWSFDCKDSLISCGIDAEIIKRFRKWSGNPEDPPPFIYSEREREHVFSFNDPAKPLCVSFCCKEALFKALARPYNFNKCEMLYRDQEFCYNVHIKDIEGLESEKHTLFAYLTRDTPEECVLSLYLFRKA